MPTTVLVTTGNGMFGRALIDQLAGLTDINVRAMVRNRASFDVEADNVSVVVADMDNPASLASAVADVSHIFLVSPMDAHIADRERNVVDAALDAGARPHIVKIFGAVNHRGDALVRMHEESIGHIVATGLPWTLVSPNSVMETSLLPYNDMIKVDAIFGMTGHGKVGFVALSDVAAVAAAVLRDDTAIGRDVKVTGPQALDMFDVAQAFSDALGRKIHYYDMPEDAYVQLLLDNGAFPNREALDIGVLVHMRAWARGDANLVTDSVNDLTRRPATTLAQWIHQNLAHFDAPQTDADRVAAAGIAAQFAAEASRN
jgi:uncharacterized protein YbjT (DUF2867 family)